MYKLYNLADHNASRDILLLILGIRMKKMIFKWQLYVKQYKQLLVKSIAPNTEEQASNSCYMCDLHSY